MTDPRLLPIRVRHLLTRVLAPLWAATSLEHESSTEHESPSERAPGDGGTDALVRWRYLPFEPVRFRPGEAVRLCATAQLGPLRPRRLVLTTTAPAGTVAVRDVNCGVDSMLAGNGGLPAEALGPDVDPGPGELGLRRLIVPGTELRLALQSLEPAREGEDGPEYIAQAVLLADMDA